MEMTLATPVLIPPMVHEGAGEEEERAAPGPSEPTPGPSRGRSETPAAVPGTSNGGTGKTMSALLRLYHQQQEKEQDSDEDMFATLEVPAGAGGDEDIAEDIIEDSTSGDGVAGGGGVSVVAGLINFQAFLMKRETEIKKEMNAIVRERERAREKERERVERAKERERERAEAHKKNDKRMVNKFLKLEEELKLGRTLRGRVKSVNK